MSVDGSAVDTCVRVHKSIYLSIYLAWQRAASAGPLARNVRNPAEQISNDDLVAVRDWLG